MSQASQPDIKDTAPRPQWLYEGVVEVAETGRRKCNLFLEAGYRLLTVSVVTRMEKGVEGNRYVRRDFGYVLGRDAQTPHFDPPKPEAQP